MSASIQPPVVLSESLARHTPVGSTAELATDPVAVPFTLLLEQLHRLLPPAGASQLAELASAGLGLGTDGKPLPSGSVLPAETDAAAPTDLAALLQQLLSAAGAMVAPASAEGETQQGTPAGSGEGLREVLRMASTWTPAPQPTPAAATPGQPQLGVEPAPTPEGVGTGVAVAAPAGMPATERASPPTPTFEIPVAVRQPGWDQAIGSRVLWLVQENVQSAELRLHPAHLGPVEVRVGLEAGHASIQFAAQDPATREALNAALPRLRELLGEHGIQLANVNVSQQSLGEQRGQSWHGSGPLGASSAAEGGDIDTADTEQPSSVAGVGLVDYYV